MVVNPRENASGKEAEIPVKATPASLKREKEKNIVIEKNIPNDDDIPKCKFLPLFDYKSVPHFPQALA